ncbi:MAG: hypothetical protein ACLFUG_10610 [Nitriliruptoraceae bacterium]
MSEPASDPDHQDPVSERVLKALDGLEDLPVADHLAVLERVNRAITDELAALDEV